MPVEDNDPETIVANVVRNPLRYRLSEVTSCIPIGGGVVHHVWELQTPDGRFFLKVRGRRFARIPAIEGNPGDIAFEAKAVRLLGAEMPERFPRLIYSNSQEGVLITTDVVHEGASLETLLRQRAVRPALLEKFGNVVRAIHRRAARMENPVRGELEDEFYRAKLKHKLGSRNNPVLQELIREMSADQPRQVILGDPSPKNIGVREAERFTFFDLEDVHRGNVVFELGFLAGHFLLHALPDAHQALAHVRAFFAGYGERALNARLVKAVALGTLQYRLGSIVPYATSLSYEEETKLLGLVEECLNTANLAAMSWEALVKWLLRDSAPRSQGPRQPSSLVNQFPR
jgi:Phosphotransferase enzyme family